MKQRIISVQDNYKGLDDWLRNMSVHRLMLVCDDSLRFMEPLNRKLAEVEAGGTKILHFSDFQPNPLYESAVRGVKRFHEEECDAIFAVGGGSAMDVAKCIKRYSSMEGDGEDGSFLTQKTVPNSIPFIAMPTTAGTGSEATRFAVLYYRGAKQSITDEGVIPDTVLMDPGSLITLPLYQKKATMMDALCHAIESFWSVNSTEESREHSRRALTLILNYMDEYLANTDKGREKMLLAANVAGQAINITQTTAGHAMCYKITSIFGVPHGHAAILCNRVLYPWMIRNLSSCTDPRGEEYLWQTLDEIGCALGGTDAVSGAERLERIFRGLELEIPAMSDRQLAELVKGVNPDRLKNHPISLDEEKIRQLYLEILKK